MGFPSSRLVPAPPSPLAPKSCSSPSADNLCPPPGMSTSGRILYSETTGILETMDDWAYSLVPPIERKALLLCVRSSAENERRSALKISWHAPPFPHRGRSPVFNLPTFKEPIKVSSRPKISQQMSTQAVEIRSQDRDMTSKAAGKHPVIETCCDSLLTSYALLGSR